MSGGQLAVVRDTVAPREHAQFGAWGHGIRLEVSAFVMKRTPLILLACILLISPALALGLSRSHIEPPPRTQPTARTRFIPLDEGAVVMTLPPLIITVPARRSRVHPDERNKSP